MESKPRTRLVPVDNHAELKPWRKAVGLEDFYVYWMSADFPMRIEQRRWVCSFLELFSEVAERKWGLSARVFVQVKAIFPDLADHFLRVSQNCAPLLGLERRGNLLPERLPDKESIVDLQSGRLKFSFRDHASDYCYWFSGQRPKEHYRMFAGFGGLTAGFIESKSNTESLEALLPPGVRRDPALRKLLEKSVASGGHEIAQATTEPFLKKTKELFGRGLEMQPQFPGLLFILPQLESQDCFTQPTQVKDCLSVFNVYVRESVADGGVLLISTHNCDEELVNLTAALRKDVTVYEHGRV